MCAHEFVATLASDYGFDRTNIEILGKLYEVEYRYRLGKSFEGEADLLKEQRKDLKKLLKAYHAFRNKLAACGEDYLNLEIRNGAELSGNLDPNLDPTDYPEESFSKNSCYWFEFERYLTFFERGLEKTIKDYKNEGGRRKNQGLETALPYIAEFWTETIGKQFTLDYERGAGLSEAFSFVKRLVAPLEDVTDTQIITVMRRWIKEENESERRRAVGFAFDSQEPGPIFE